MMVTEDDVILRELRTALARISIWGLLASPSVHRDSIVRALSRIQIDTTTSPEDIILMMTSYRAFSIEFFDKDLSPIRTSYTRALYITVLFVGCKVSFVLRNNGSALDVYPLGMTVALGYDPSDFETSLQTLRAYDNSRGEVVEAMILDVQVRPASFRVIFQVFDILTSLSQLLDRL